MHQRTFARVSPMRARAIFYALLAVAAFLTWRLYDVQVAAWAQLTRRALAQRSDTVEVFARRGSILDRNGNVLVRSLPSESVYAVPRELSDPGAAIAKLQKVFGKLDPATVAGVARQNLVVRLDRAQSAARRRRARSGARTWRGSL